MFPQLEKSSNCNKKMWKESRRRGRQKWRTSWKSKWSQTKTFSTDIYSVYFELFFHNFATRLHRFSYFNEIFDVRTRKNILTDSKNSFFLSTSNSNSAFPIRCVEVVYSTINYSSSKKWLSALELFTAKLYCGLSFQHKI